MEHLEQASKDRSAKNLFLAAAELRKLLIQEPRIIAEVQRETNLKAFYTIVDPELLKDLPPFPRQPTFELWSIEPGPAAVTVQVKVDRFLRVPVGSIDGQDVSVHDLINFVANKEGAVHFGLATDHHGSRMQSLNRTLQIMGLPPFIQPLVGIANVTIKALRPLVAGLEAGWQRGSDQS